MTRTKEHKNLAIKMWRDAFDKFDKNEFFDIVDFKREWCERHNVDWRFNCWLCDVFFNVDDHRPEKRCERCPLMSCDDENSLYYLIKKHADDGGMERESLMDWCQGIIECMELVDVEDK